MKEGMCIHYNGCANPVSKGICRAGVEYKSLTGGITPGWATRLPCTDMEPKGGDKMSCDKHRLPTAEELAESKRETDEHIKRFMVAYTGNVAEWRRQNKWDRNNPKGASGSVPCEVCGTGKIELSMASYNGHVHGKCTTEGCISWME